MKTRINPRGAGRPDASLSDSLANGQWRFGPFYASGAVMGFSPQAINAMSLWQLITIIDGWNAHHAPADEQASLTSSETEELWEFIKDA